MTLTHSVFLFPCQLTRRLKVDSKNSKLALIVFAGIFYRIDMERYGGTVHWKNDRLRFAVDKNLYTSK